MTTTLRDDRPVNACRSSCGFCEAGRGQAPGRCHDRHGRCKGTYYRAVRKGVGGPSTGDMSILADLGLDEMEQSSPAAGPGVLVAARFRTR